jgi:ankyrin repeat protein
MRPHYSARVSQRYTEMPLLTAMQFGTVAVAKVLLDAGFRDDGERALQLAYERNHLAMVKLLFEYGVAFSQKLFELAESGVVQ